MFSQFWFTNFASGMKLKLKTLSIAIAAGTLSLSAQADLKIGGDIGVGYFQSSSGDNEVKEAGSEINFDAPEKVGGTTFYGHVEVDMAGTGNTAEFEEIRVGAKGAWGELILGEADNACDQLDVGGTNEVWVTHSQGGCQGADVNNIVYKRSFGAMSAAISANVENAEENVAVGLKGKMGPVTASFGYEDGDLDANPVTPDVDNITVGLSGAFGPATIGVRANQMDGGDTDVGANFMISRGANNFYGGIGDVGNTDSWSLGYKRVMGKTDLIAELADTDGTTDSAYALGLRHRF